MVSTIMWQFWHDVETCGMALNGMAMHYIMWHGMALHGIEWLLCGVALQSVAWSWPPINTGRTHFR